MAEAIIRERCASAEAGPAQAYESVARFLLNTHAAMPDYLRLPLKSLTLVFGLSALATAGRPFHRLSHERRARQVRAWKESALGPRVKCSFVCSFSLPVLRCSGALPERVRLRRSVSG